MSQTYKKCAVGEQICYVGVVSLSPTVNALDEYAVGYRKHINATAEDISKDNVIGLVECEVVPNTQLHIPVLPDNDNGKLLFHNNVMTGTWTTIELRKSLEMGYKIKRRYAATSYTPVNGLMKECLMHALRMKLCNNKTLSRQQCDEISQYHKRIDFKEWKHIDPEATSKSQD